MDEANLITAIVSAVAGIVSAIVAMLQYRRGRPPRERARSSTARRTAAKVRSVAKVKDDDHATVLGMYGGSLGLFGVMAAIFDEPSVLIYMMLLYFLGIVVSVGVCVEDWMVWRRAKLKGQEVVLSRWPYVFLVEGIAAMAVAFLLVVILS